MALDLGLDSKRGRYERCLTKLTARDGSYRGESDVELQAGRTACSSPFGKQRLPIVRTEYW